MEAIEFLKEYKRMCNSYKYCSDCPLVGENCLSLGVRNKNDSNFLKIASEVEAWSKEHPVITNRMKFKEVFGDEAMYTIASPNMQALINWLDEPYKERGNA